MGETGEVQALISTSEKPKRQPSLRNLKRKFSADEEDPPTENNKRNLRWALLLWSFVYFTEFVHIQTTKTNFNSIRMNNTAWAVSTKPFFPFSKLMVASMLLLLFSLLQ